MSPEPHPTNPPEDEQPPSAAAGEPDPLEQAVYGLLAQKYAGFELKHGKRDERDD